MNEGRSAARSIEVLVLETRGSVPREAGTRMWVDAAATRGTIGGGNLEHSAIRLAREMLASGEREREQRYTLGDMLGQCCGGAATLRFTAIDSLPQEDAEPQFQVVLFGAGHVGREVARILERLPCRLMWVDSRAEAFPPARGPHTTVVLDDEPAWAVDEAPAGAYYLVMTHSHALDLELVERILRRPDAAFVGLIGSESKAAKFKAQLRRRRLPETVLARLVCPIGLFKGGKHPAEVAVSAVAQLLELRRAQVPVGGALERVAGA